MKTQGFDFDPAALENPGVVPTSLSQAESTAYSEALFGRLESPQPDRVRITELAEDVRDGVFDPSHNCLDLASWYNMHFTSGGTPSIDDVDPFDPDDDPVIGRLVVEFQECIVSQGVTATFVNPEELLLEIQYLEFSQQEAAGSANRSGTPEEEPNLADDRAPLTDEQLDELAGLRSADFACSGDYYNGFALRVNELNGAPAE